MRWPFGKQRREDADFAEEIRTHLQLEADQLTREGLSGAEADSAARRAFGNVTTTQERFHDSASFVRIERFGQDLRRALRALVKNRAFASIAIVTLALGIGATSTMFTIVNAVLLRPLPFPDARRLISVSESEKGQDMGVATSQDFVEWRRSTPSFAAIALIGGGGAVLTGVKEPLQLSGSAVSADFLPVLGVLPAIGRNFRSDENVPGASRVVILSHTLWQTAFAGDSGVLGHVITLDGTPFTVIGVMPTAFAYPRGDAYWTALQLDAPVAGSTTTYYFDVIGRLREGSTIDRARAELAAAVHRVEAGRPEWQGRHDAVAMSLHERMYGSTRPALLMLLGAVGFLLLIACANVAHLMLARTATRQHELAVRMALGARRGDLVRQLFAETVPLAALGGFLGLLIPFWSVGLFVRMDPESVARMKDIHVDGTVLAVTLLISLFTAALFGLAPAIAGARTDLLTALKNDATRSTASARSRRFRGALVVAEIATALLLVTGAGLLTRSFTNALSVDLGFRPDGLLGAQIQLSSQRYPDAAARQMFFERLADHVRGLPGVQTVAISDGLPLHRSGPSRSFGGRDQPTIPVIVSVGSREYPRAIGLELVAGRLFDQSDRSGGAPSVILSMAAARAFFPNGKAVGQRIDHPLTDGGGPSIVIGVVKDVPQRGVDVTPIPQAYLAFEQQRGGWLSTLVVRASTDAALLEPAIRRAVAEVDPLQPVSSFSTMDDDLAKSVASRRQNSLVVDVFAALSVIFAAIGLYGVMTYEVQQREKELGLRIALGAASGGVVVLVARRGMFLATIGIMAGIALSFALSRTLTGMLYGVSTHDPVTFASAPLALACVALIACSVPAWRATRVDPVTLLRVD